MVEAALADPLLGRKLGRHRLERRLAQGGMATVYLAKQEGPGGFDRAVAIKVVHAHLAREQRFSTMFLDEAQLTGKLHHPNICGVIEFGEQDGLLYLVMEYLHGETLSAVVRRGWRDGGALPPPLVARIVCDAARGLHAAHELRDEQGQPLELVHRDVSPQNVMVLYDGHTKLTDFGIARARGRLTHTATGEVKGKISFMSPEQLQSGLVDRRTDVWALGVVTWEALTGRRLFRGDNEGATALNVVNAAIPPPSSVVSDIPPALDRVVTRALSRDLSTRTSSAAELADELEAYLYGRGRPLGATEVAAWMDAHFAERQRARRAAFEAPREPAAALSPSGTSLPLAELKTQVLEDLEVEAPVPEPPTEEQSAVRTTGITPERRAGRRRRASAWLGGVFGLMAVASLALILSWTDAGEPAPSTTLPSTAGPQAVTHAAVPRPGPPSAEAPANTTSDTPADDDPTAQPNPRPSTEADTGPSNAQPTSGQPASPPPPTDARATAERSNPQIGRPASPRPTGARTSPRPAPATASPPTTAPPGQLNLLAIPQAEVFLRGRSLGRTPLVSRELPAGRHTLELREVSGARRTLRVPVVIEPDQRTNRSVRFE